MRIKKVRVDLREQAQCQKSHSRTRSQQLQRHDSSQLLCRQCSFNRAVMKAWMSVAVASGVSERTPVWSGTSGSMNHGSDGEYEE